jgi:hypothetical protein
MQNNDPKQNPHREIIVRPYTVRANNGISDEQAGRALLMLAIIFANAASNVALIEATGSNQNAVLDDNLGNIGRRMLPLLPLGIFSTSIYPSRPQHVYLLPPPNPVVRNPHIARQLAPDVYNQGGHQ